MNLSSGIPKNSVPASITFIHTQFLLMAQDMERAVTFYRDVMGLSEDFSSPDWSELRFGDAILGLHGGGDGSRCQSGLSIQYEDVEQAYRNALAGGATGTQAPERREGEPIVLASIADPEGNVIMLTQFVGHACRGGLCDSVLTRTCHPASPRSGRQSHRLPRAGLFLRNRRRASPPLPGR